MLDFHHLHRAADRSSLLVALRKEFQFDPCISSIDAPSLIPAGSTRRIETPLSNTETYAFACTSRVVRPGYEQRSKRKPVPFIF